MAHSVKSLVYAFWTLNGASQSDITPSQLASLFMVIQETRSELLTLATAAAPSQAAKYDAQPPA